MEEHETARFLWNNDIIRIYKDMHDPDIATHRFLRTSDTVHDNECAWMDRPDWNWLHDLMLERIEPFSESIASWGIGPIRKSTVQYNHYGIGEGYGWHVDHDPQVPAVARRELTLVARMNNEPTGCFEFRDFGKVDLQYGEGVLVPGRRVHRAVPPTGAPRDSLTVWFYT